MSKDRIIIRTKILKYKLTILHTIAQSFIEKEGDYDYQEVILEANHLFYIGWHRESSRQKEKEGKNKEIKKRKERERTRLKIVNA